MGTIKEKIFILHGWTYDLEKWSVFVSLLKKDGLDVVLLKIPGLSEESNEIWDLNKYGKWLSNKVKNEKDKLILIGHSNGGRIASFFTANFPDRVKKLILIDSAGVTDDSLKLRFKKYFFGSIAKVGKKVVNFNFLRNILYKLVGERDYYNAPQNMKETMINMIKTDMTQYFGKIKTPTLIIWGENDTVTPISDGYKISKLITNSRVRLISNAKHSPFFTHPNEVVEIIKNDF